MRIWHKDLIPYLPKNQLLAQWRECCCIARNIAVNGTPNHILVNSVLDYPMEHFWNYARVVTEEMKRRNYKFDVKKFTKWHYQYADPLPDLIVLEMVFSGWHNDRYLRQCYYNLEEKHDRGGISDEEWKIIEEQFKEKIKNTEE